MQRETMLSKKKRGFISCQPDNIQFSLDLDGSLTFAITVEPLQIATHIYHV